jgi:hypothetical protein
MELSAEKKFEKEKYQNQFQMYENTKEGTNTHSRQKNSFNIQEIKAYLEENNNLSNEFEPHLITDVNNNFSSRKELFSNESGNNEDLVMNQSYNYNPNLSNYSSKIIASQNLLQISQNKNDNLEPINNDKILNNSSKKNEGNLIDDIVGDEGNKEEDICNTFEEDNNEIKTEENDNEYINKTKDKNKDKEELQSTSKKNKEKNFLQYKLNEKNNDTYNEVDFLEIKEDIFGKYVDNIIKRSYHVYKNRQCPSCAILLSKGKSCTKCPKYHHLIKKGK